MAPELLEPEHVHRFKNQIGLALGFCELLLDVLPADDLHRDDIAQIKAALDEALELLPAVLKTAAG